MIDVDSDAFLREQNLGAVMQKQLQIQWFGEIRHPSSVLKFSDCGFRAFSQNEEDGLLLFIFSNIGTVSKSVLEVGCGAGVESNSANLIINHHWNGTIVDLKNTNTRRAESFYSKVKETKIWPPRIINQKVTAENINGIVKGAMVNGELDLLSIDVDGIDYWLWNSVTYCSPRVLVIETNHLWGSSASVTVPYSADFEPIFTEHGSDYAGASIPALVKLGKTKGYTFVGANRFATNAFFVRDDCMAGLLTEVDVESVFSHPRAKFGNEVRLLNVKHLEWQEV